MGVSLKMFVDFAMNGTSFANNEYYSTEAWQKNLSGNEISTIQNIWEDLEKYSLMGTIGCAALALTVSVSACTLDSPLFGVATIIAGIALTIFAFVRYCVATFEKATWDKFEPGQDWETRANLGKKAVETRNDEIQAANKDMQNFLNTFNNELNKKRK